MRVVGGVVAVAVVLLIVVVGVAYFYAPPPAQATAPTISTQSTSTGGGTSAVSGTATSTTGPPSVHAVQVVIPAVNGEPGSDGTNQFNPQMITVVIGVNNTVTWTNLDQVPHNVLTASGFSSGDLATGQSYTYTFTTPGTYHYTCSYYPIMNGEVIVEIP